MGMQMHQTNIEPLLDKMGIEYDPDLKYAGKDGKVIGKPMMVGCGC
jgi:heterodisulfide reductase subunit B